MMQAFGGISQHIKFRKKVAVIDNPVFKLNYRITFLFFLAGSVLVSTRQYIGEHIRCIVDGGVPTHVVETFCFFTTTFTVVRHLNESAVTDRFLPHPGIGPFVPEEPVLVHAYYQWVPFVLFGQALFFYLPHLMWKRIEGGRILAMVTGFENAALSLGDNSITVKSGKVPSKVDRENMVTCVRKAFIQRLHINKFWSFGLIMCEILNSMNVFLQIYIIDRFLKGGFMDLGPRVLSPQRQNEVDPLDMVFPKVTKCTFHKYGPSGSIQTHDALCVMALNIINEKIYTFLWFWMVIMVAVTVCGVAWRILTLLLHSRSQKFNKMVFKTALDRNSLRTITERCDFADWLFLSYIGKSMDGFVFKELLNQLAFEMEENKAGAETKNGDSEQARLES